MRLVSFGSSILGSPYVILAIIVFVVIGVLFFGIAGILMALFLPRMILAIALGAIGIGLVLGMIPGVEGAYRFPAGIIFLVVAFVIGTGMIPGV